MKLPQTEERPSAGRCASEGSSEQMSKRGGQQANEWEGRHMRGGSSRDQTRDQASERAGIHAVPGAVPAAAAQQH